MVDGYHLSYPDVMDSVAYVLSQNRSFRRDLKCTYSSEIDTGNTAYDTSVPPGSIGCKPTNIRISVKSLEENMLDSGVVRDSDAVWVIMQAFHESAHVWQHSVAYMQCPDDTSDEIKNMARGMAICACFPAYRDMSYLLDLSELHASRHSVIQTKRFFDGMSKQDSRFGQVDVDGILCDWAKRIYGITWPDMNKCNTVDDVAYVFTRSIDKAPYRKKFKLDYMRSREHESRALHRLLSDGNTMFDVLSAEDGIRETELLCQYIGRNHPEWFRELICIRDEYCNQNVLGAFDKVLSAARGVRTRRYVDLPEIDDGSSSDDCDLSL